MKNTFKLLPVLAFACFCNAAQAQTAPMAASDKDKMHHDKMEHEHMMMKDGKMMVKKDGKTMPMTETMTLSNGDKVMTDGTVMMKDGKKMMLKEGEKISMDGKVHEEKMHDEKAKSKM